MTCVTGDETGLVKVWDVRRSSGGVLLHVYGRQSRARGITGLTWVEAALDKAVVARADGTVCLYDPRRDMAISAQRIGVTPAVPGGIAVVQGRLVVVAADGTVAVPAVDALFAQAQAHDVAGLRRQANAAKARRTEANRVVAAADGESDDGEEDGDGGEAVGTPADDVVSKFAGNGPNVRAAHVHRRLALVAMGGTNNDLGVYNIAPSNERPEVPLFRAQNVEDHVLGVPMPVDIVGAAIVDSHVTAVATAQHACRFYDRRVSARPVQEFDLHREIARRPTCLLQWNSNKFCVGDATGDVHLYDCRRGFASRAKLRGGVGSVRQMLKHPGGEPILTVVGLDRKARVYHLQIGRAHV